MTMGRYIRRGYHLLSGFISDPGGFLRVSSTVPPGSLAYRFSRAYREQARGRAPTSADDQKNPLRDFFENRREGRGIMKWEHYFEIYHRHLARFIGRPVRVLEVGVYSGGSLEMWREYFGHQSHLYGVDIEEACRVYESDDVSIFIGDQADRAFWASFRDKVEGVDIVVDDGGHAPEMQRVTLEEMLPHIRPGGVYICEDVHGCLNRFAAYATGLVSELNHMHCPPVPEIQSTISPFQASIHSIHFYPYVVVIEKRADPLGRLACPRHGTEWQPFGW